MLQHTFFRYFPETLPNDDTTNQMLAMMHDDWNAHVRRVMQEVAHAHNVPLHEVFLEFEVAQGWQPLCDFLQIDECPTDTPFPHVNDRAHYERALFIFDKIGYIYTVFLLAIVYLVVRWGTRRVKGPTAGEKKHQ